MKVLQVFNQYRSLLGGEEVVVGRIAAMVNQWGGEATLWTRSSRGLDNSLLKKVRASISGVYSRKAYRQMRERLELERPDVVHAHNLYPLFSPSVLVACKDAGVPLVMTVHNHSLTCPRADHLVRGEICERCTGGKVYLCVLRNCRGNILESIAYATRSSFARRKRLFLDNVDMLIALADFARRRFVESGFAPEQVAVLPNLFAQPYPPVSPENGTYIAYAGRMSAEKGVDCLLKAASLLPQCALRLAGDGPMFLPWKGLGPGNAVFLGRVEPDAMDDFYRGARFVVVPSKSSEMSPLVIVEAMSHGLPVVASRVGGIPEMVEHGVTGLLFEQGNHAELAQKMRQLWEDPGQCHRMGQAAHQKTKQYGEDAYYQKLMGIYERAIACHG